MPMTRALLGEQGVTFSHMLATTPVCCPSRSGFVTGRYIHNVGVVNNSIPGNCAGLPWQQGPELFNIGWYLQQAGYRTGYAGKYLNNYGFPEVGGTAHVPRGWDFWNGLVGNSQYYNYNMSLNGKTEVHNASYFEDYLPLVLLNRTTDFILNATVRRSERGVADRQPFFWTLAAPSSHQPADPAPQHADAFPGFIAPRVPNYNKTNKNAHWFVRDAGYSGPLNPNSAAWTDLLARRRLQTLLFVDEIVNQTVALLDAIGELNNTFILYTSDHGYHLGSYGLGLDKRQLYETDTRMPLFVRGPGLPRNLTIDAPVLNIDVAPTFLDVAGLATPSNPLMDGESMLPKIAAIASAPRPLARPPSRFANRSAVARAAAAARARGEPRPVLSVTKYAPGATGVTDLRTQILIEYNGEFNDAGFVPNKTVCPQVPGGEALTCFAQLQYDVPPLFNGTDFCACQDVTNNTYACVRSLDDLQNTVYCEFVTGEREFYDIDSDPWQMDNIIGQLAPIEIDHYHRALLALRTCAGPSCGRSSVAVRAQG